jgi:hypothetical protein
MQDETAWELTHEDDRNSKESRRERFERLGKSRMHRVLNTIRLLGNLSTPNYQWSEADIEMMRKAIDQTTEKTFSKFKRQKYKEPVVDFDFKSRQ